MWTKYIQKLFPLIWILFIPNLKEQAAMESIKGQ